MSSEWFYMKGASKQGPVNSTRLKELADNGALEPTDLVWREGMRDWKRARKIDGLFDGKKSASSSVTQAAANEPTIGTSKERPPAPPGNLLGLIPPVCRPQAASSYQRPPNNSAAATSPPPVANSPVIDGILRCPHCSQEISNDPTMAGDLVGCPHCAREFRMPQDSASQASVSAGIAINVAPQKRTPAFWLWGVPGLFPIFGKKESTYVTVGVVVLLCAALFALSIAALPDSAGTKSPEAPPIVTPNKKPVKTPEMQWAELLLFVFLGSLFLAFLTLCLGVLAIFTSCPKCKHTFARRRTARHYLGCRHGMSTRTRVDQYYGANGPGLFQTPTGYGTRTEQVAVERSFHKNYWKCRYCGHAWDTVTVTESEVW